MGLGALALGQFLGGGQRPSFAATTEGLQAARPTHFSPRAKSVIYLFMAGAPSQFELFDYKKELQRRDGETAPASFFPKDKTFAFIGKGAKLLGTQRSFSRHGQCGKEVSELLPHIAKVADELCWIKSMKTDVFNHGPAKLFMNTGFQAPGRPCFGSWVMYGIGSLAQDLPGFVVLQSGPRGPRAGNSLWSSGFLPTNLQGVPFRGTGDPILNLQSPEGVSPARQRQFVDLATQLNEERLRLTGDPEIATRISAYEMAFRMQTSAPELVDLASEPAHVLASYGASPGENSFANNCLLARRLVERGVPFVQLYHTDWDDHGGPNDNLGEPLARRCRQVDQASAALVADLKSRGLLDETIVIWGGEFGRTPMGEVREGIPGRDHHIEAFTIWLAGGGFKPGHIQGATDELGYYAVEGQVHVHDLHATLLHQLGFDHERLTFRFQGRDHRLTDVYGNVRRELLA
jgi:hypothetical protein